MRKQELIHIHGLLAQVEEFCEVEGGLNIDLESYADEGTQPTSIHKSKSDHKDAVFALSNDIIDSFEQEASETIPASAD